MRLIVLHVVVSILFALELDHKCVQEAILDLGKYEIPTNIHSGTPSGEGNQLLRGEEVRQHICKPSGLLYLAPLAGLRYILLLMGWMHLSLRLSMRSQACVMVHWSRS